MAALNREQLQRQWQREKKTARDDQLLSTVYEALAKGWPKSRTRGRLGTPAEVVLPLLWLGSSTAADANALSRRFKITHPFHPWSGQEFELVTYLHTWGENRVYFHQEKGEHLVSVPASWTDVVPEDPLLQLAAGRSLFRVPDLVELAQMMEVSRRKRVKEITP